MVSQHISQRCLLAVLLACLGACGAKIETKSAATSAPGSKVPAESGNRLLAVDSEVAKDWIRVSAGQFSFSLPPDAVKSEIQAIDSYIGAYTSRGCTFVFDYGLQAASAKDPDELVGGKMAKISTEDRARTIDGTRYENFASITFAASVQPGANLSMWANCKSSEDQSTAKAVFRSIRFE